ncbi:MAG: hypothetical protein A2Z24_01875 [Candidatus Woykebacteria bacterium RBG_16_44_10]|uniref:4Fe-4S ferredoxin-type domain-containing protein n=1 Tax=Candidatus Woykebacteria bacterium RBG_16_44_10 TaxID=1802597 RepID=A0A1G1WER2_9BACT|nr:MAG: hypothetical protein A2Z24_01875 [Candidatus Woykebacteria bacterium RBG_16_44_10]
MPRVISQGNIPNLITDLKKSHDVFGPMEKDGEVVFGKVEDPTNVLLRYKTTLLPPKIFFLPPEEELFKVTNGRVQEGRVEKPFIIFGLNRKDLEAIVYLDQIMGKKPADTFYLNRRKSSILIGVFEEEVGVPPGGDLILEMVSGNDYRAIALTEKGRIIANSEFFKEGKVDGKVAPTETPSKLDQMLLDSELIAQAIKWSRENYRQVWERLGKVCIGCGICTYVCPLCYCTSTEDKTSFDQSVCSRCRKWDACTLPGFAQIAGGHNFRPTQAARYFNWFYHKFVRAYKEFGQAQCVACGRCQKYCPAGIDIEKVLEEIIDAFQKAQPTRKF